MTTELNNESENPLNKTTDIDNAMSDLAVKQNDRVNARIAVKSWNLPGKADALVGTGTAGMTPGNMQMSAVVKLHSRLSINLFRGRKGEPATNTRPIIGLARFGRQVALVWSASGMDDPFADQCLMDIEIAYEQAIQTLNSKMKSMEQLLALDEFAITLQASEKPVDLELKFFSPWGFRGATLLKQFDKLVRMALTARHLGLFTEDDWNPVIHESQRVLRHMFNEVDGWISTGVRRADIRTGNPLAVRAQTRYTELKKGYLVLDGEIISGKLRAKLSPPNRILENYWAETAKNKILATEVPLVESVKKIPAFGFSANQTTSTKKTATRRNQSATPGEA